MKPVYIVGVRGIPNRYGGFERLVEVLAPHLARHGRRVVVFCESDTPEFRTDVWRGVERHYLPRGAAGVVGTIRYDLQAFRRVPRGAVALIFGYGTALFQPLLRARAVPHCVNMDGIEWKREKWGAVARVWLRVNEWIAARTSDVLIADHPEIERDLNRRFGVCPRMIAYGVDVEPPMTDRQAATLSAGHKYFLIIARPEPENQIHVMLAAHRRSQSDAVMVVVGGFAATPYGRSLMREYPQAIFTGPVYDGPTLNALRRDAELYLHGHCVGGTNPSLIEAMAAKAVIVAHDNPFNAWVLGDGGQYFTDVVGLAELMRRLPSPAERAAFGAACLQRCATDFLWSHILLAYADVVATLEQLAPDDPAPGNI